MGEEEARGQVFRYLRADHSILGGLWVGPARDALREMLSEEIGGGAMDVVEKDVVERAESIYVSDFTLVLEYAGTDYDCSRLLLCRNWCDWFRGKIGNLQRRR